MLDLMSSFEPFLRLFNKTAQFLEEEKQAEIVK